MKQERKIIIDKDYKFTPHFDDVIISPRVVNETKSGIILQDGSEIVDPISDVVAVGDDVTKYKKGDTVFVNAPATAPLPGKNLHYMIVKEKNIMCHAEELKE